eukprot:gb/GECG01007106.1/.p1 GENE.gb/GECG01007106.1/~~gb/GECG01007106.1/.p1  ORF type:complete len:632 (+),score=85.99 gb/GECG01007106.1/:1-1896(+)
MEGEEQEELKDPLTSQVFDYVIYGTGLKESFLAQELAKRHYSVLHLDKQPFYGGSDATLTLAELMAWLQKNQDYLQQHSKSDSNERNAELLRFLNGEVGSAVSLNNGTTGQEAVPEREEVRRHYASIHPDLSVVATDFDPFPETLWETFRRSLFDLTPRVTLSKGSMVDVIVEENMDEYCEFKAFDASLTVATGDAGHSIIKVPSSKSDIFSSTSLALREKRQLMRLLQYLIDYASYMDGFENVRTTNEGYLAKGRSLARPQNKGDSEEGITNDEKDVQSFLSKFELSHNLRRLVVHVMAFLPFEDSAANFTTAQFKELLRKMVRAMGRFGGSGFILSRYGSGDLPQAFCRRAAVHGALYVLNCPVHLLSREDDSFGIVLENGTRIKGRNLILPSDCLGRPEDSGFCRINAAVVLKKSLFDILPQLFDYVEEGVREGTSGDVTFSSTGRERHVITIPPNSPIFSNPGSLILYQQDSSCEVVPESYYLVYFVTVAAGSARAQKAMSNLRHISSMLNEYSEASNEGNVVWFGSWASCLFDRRRESSERILFSDSLLNREGGSLLCHCATCHTTDSVIDDGKSGLCELLKASGNTGQDAEETPEDRTPVVAAVNTTGFDLLDEISVGSADDDSD